MDSEIRPNEKEKQFLTLAYNRFYDVFDEIEKDSFWQEDKWYRFCRIRDAFLVYVELLNYEPIQLIINHIKENRPPMEAEIGSELFKFIRNIISHFPFFDSWDEIWISKDIINWSEDGKSIDKFLEKYKGTSEIKYRVWQAKKKKMIYLSINFPKNYCENNKVYLKNILNEKEGVIFSMSLMKGIIDTQVEEIKILI